MSVMSADVFYSSLYLFLTLGVVYPPSEFLSAGITIPDIFSSYLGAEHDQFIQYHLKRSCITLLVYSLLPAGYFAGLLVLCSDSNFAEWIFSNSTMKVLIFTSSFGLPMLAIYQLLTWRRNNYEEHPITKNIRKFLNNNNTDWHSIASDINAEYRSIDKISIQVNSICRVIATENWVMKITPLMIHLVHQSDASLAVSKCETHAMSEDNHSEIQLISIDVKSRRNNIESFTIRLNSANFQDLQDRIARPIEVLPDVKFKKTAVERFIDAFKDLIENNPRFISDQRIEECIGCMQPSSNYVKLQKLCEDREGYENCTTCYCRPMWCADCMGKWFASRQSADEKYRWLSQKCTCPMCRARFCVLDVCIVENADQNNGVATL